MVSQFNQNVETFNPTEADFVRAEKEFQLLKGLEGPTFIETFHALPNPGPIALKAADIGLNLESKKIREDPPGSNKGKWVSLFLNTAGVEPGLAWCQAFIYYCMKTAGAGSKYPQTAGTQAAQNWFVNHQRFIPVSSAIESPGLVKKGDHAYFYLYVKSEHRYRIAHCAIVLSANKDGFDSLQGNTAPGGTSREGEGLYRKFVPYRRLGTYGGFGRVSF